MIENVMKEKEGIGGLKVSHTEFSNSYMALGKLYLTSLELFFALPFSKND